MRNIYIAFLSLLSFTSFSQNTISVTSANELYTETELEFSLADYELKNVQTPYGQESVVVASGMTPLLRRGGPDVPKMSCSVIIPDNGATRIEIVDAVFTDFPNLSIAASQGNIMRTENPSEIVRQKSGIYNQNAFYPSEIAIVRAPYIYRDFRGSAVIFQPFQYNPVTRTLRVYESIRLKVITNTGTDGFNEFLRTNEPEITQDLQQSYRSHFLNYETLRYSAVSDNGSMLIITHDAFADAMLPFIEWKTQTGMKVEMVNVSTIGNENQIKAFVAQYYADNNLSFLLLVGDLAQVPSPTASGGKSDPTYGYITGDDSYPEIFVGRMSAETIGDVETQVSRSITYEKNPSTNTGHFSKVINMASNQGPGDDDEMDFEHEQLIRSKLLAYTYTEAQEFYDGTQGGTDASGNPAAAAVADYLNNGAGLISYTGHGSATSFGTSGFNNDDINDLQNAGKLPLIWSVGCVNGEFDNGTCFGEAWLRATQNGEPTGAAGTFMSSINQSWDPPMCAQDEMVDILTEAIAGVTTRSFGGISINGCLKMNDEYGDAGDEMTDTWHIFGDPSLMVRTAQPLVLNVTHSPTTVIGANSLAVTVDVDNALVALVQNGLILGKSYVSGGVAQILFDPLTSMEPVLVTVTAFNRIPYQGNVTVSSPNNAFIINTQNLLSDVLGNNNQTADYNEDILIHVSLENVGTLPSTPITANIYSTEVTILSGECTFDPIDENGTVTSPDCFSFHVNDGIADQTVVHLSLAIADEAAQTWEYTIPVVVQAPSLSLSHEIVSEITGNGNGRPDANETIQIILPLTNIGHSTAVQGEAVLMTSSPWVTITQNIATVNPLNPQAPQNLVFQVGIDPNTPANTDISFSCGVNCGAYPAYHSFLIRSGVLVEDVESGDFDSYNWAVSGDVPWFADGDESFEGEYSFQSGDINDDQESTLSVTYDVTQADSIRFFKRVLCEDGYDYLRFYIDNQLQGEWTGHQEWSYVAFPVSTGNHEFKWAYEKDDMISALADAAWLDFIQFPAGIEGAQSITETSVMDDGAFVFPNPASNQVSVSITSKKGEQFNPAIFDQSGRLVYQWIGQNVTAGNNVVSLHLPAGLSAGLYFLKLESNTGIRTFSVSIQQ